MSFQRFLEGMDESKMNVPATEKDLLKALRFFVGQIVEQQMSPKHPTHEFVSALTGLVYTLLKENIPRDLVLFSKHAGRTTIRDEDFLLFCRKTSLHSLLLEYKETLSDVTKRKPKKKEKNPADDDS